MTRSQRTGPYDPLRTIISSRRARPAPAAEQQANEAVMAAGRATSAAWAAIAARRGDAKAAGEAIAEEMFAMHGPRRGWGA